MKKIKRNEVFMAFVRLAAAAMLTVNATLTAKGINPIPFDEGAFSEWATYLASGVSVVWAWWKNNNITKKAQYAQESLQALKDWTGDDGEEA